MSQLTEQNDHGQNCGTRVLNLELFLTPSITAASPSVEASHNLPKLKFKGNDRFLRELKSRIDAYFERTGYRRRDCPQMYFKTATILAWFVGAYVTLLFFAPTWWVSVPLAVVMGLAVAAIGFNIQHDGGHKAYSDHQWVNRLMASTIDLVGGSSYFWDIKHNSIHHTYTNINGHDDDIDVGVLGRLSPQQPRYAFHRFQACIYGSCTASSPSSGTCSTTFTRSTSRASGNTRSPGPRGVTWRYLSAVRSRSFHWPLPSRCSSTPSGRSSASTRWRHSSAAS